ncbi:N4 gp44-like protein (fragment) [Alteromonas alvinellae]
MSEVNDNLVLICGKSAVGKSASLMGLKNPEGVIYLNCEAGKKLPFRSKFKELVVTDPYQVEDAFDQVEEMDDVHTIVIDSLNYLMDMYESLHVLTSTNTMQA